MLIFWFIILCLVITRNMLICFNAEKTHQFSHTVTKFPLRLKHSVLPPVS